ncbi:MAG: hypothetical protein ACRDD1_05610 [Planctomycetia bacterium]
MSRSYRIQLRESLSRTVTSADGVQAGLELLDVLPPGEMAELLAAELLARGFKREGDRLARNRGGVAVEVDLRDGAIDVHVDDCAEVEIVKAKAAWVEEGITTAAHAQRELIEEMKVELAEAAARRQESLDRKTTDRLEDALADLRPELDGVVNRVTATALKKRAAELGRIKEVSEDAATGSVTIVVEV